MNGSVVWWLCLLVLAVSASAKEIYTPRQLSVHTRRLYQVLPSPALGGLNVSGVAFPPSATRTCSSVSDCAASEFCQQQAVPGVAIPSSCQPCWKACLECSQDNPSSECLRCQCNTGRPCTDSATNCGLGTFCNAQKPFAQCKSCYACITDEQVAGAGGCESACNHPARSYFPALALPFVNGSERNTRWVVDAFFQVNQATRGLNAGLATVGALQAALVSLGVVGGGATQAELVFVRANTNGDARVSRAELVSALFGRPPLDTFCHNDPMTVPDVFPGCPCNALAGAVDPSALTLVDVLAKSSPTGRCPAGHRCSAAAYEHLRQFSLLEPPRPFVGLCVPCLLGEFCAAGTVERTKEAVRACGSAASLVAPSGTSDVSGSLEFCNGFSLCPAGNFCPNPTTLQACGTSFYCPVGSVVETSCILNETVQENPFRMIRAPSQSLLQSLLTQKKPVGGNVCPSGSVTPFMDCPAGSYCPKPNAANPCPRGFYCPRGSEAPMKCPLLRSCEPGTSEPGLSWGGLVVLLLVLSIIPLVLLGYHRRVRLHQEKQRKADSLLEFMTTMRFSTPFTSAPAELDSDGGAAASAAGAHKKRRCCGCLSSACAVIGEELRSYSTRVQLWVLAGVYAVCRGWFNVKYGVPTRFRVLCGGIKGAAYGVMAHPAQHVPKCHFSADCPTCCKTLNLSSVTHVNALSGAEPSSALELSQEDVRLFGIPRKERIAVEWRCLTLRLPSGKLVLSNCSGMFEHGMLHAIMGPSGSGKSTFLATLCNKASYAKRTGDVDLFKGADRGSAVRRGLEELQYMQGFVPQDDIVHEDLTVRENLLYAARLRLPNDVTWSEKLAMVRRLVALLGLSHVQHNPVGSVEKRGISGGQRKRVNIGMELAAKPSLLLLDEPTSGLDSAMSQDLLALLRKLARTGTNIITTIHQPRYSIFLMFDSVLLLGVGGHTVFLGHSACALQYFERLGFPLPDGENPADFLLDAISGTVPRLRSPSQGSEPAGVDTAFIPSTLFRLWTQVIEAGGLDRLPSKELFAAGAGALRKSGGLVRVGTSWVRPIAQVARPRDLEGAFDKFNDIDTDRSGKLSEAELNHCWAALEAVLPPRDFEAFLKGFKSSYDTDPITGEAFITRESFMRCVELRLFPLRQQQEGGGLSSQPSDNSDPILAGFRQKAEDAATKLNGLTQAAITLTARQARTDAKLAYGLLQSRHFSDISLPDQGPPPPRSHDPLPTIPSIDEELGARGRGSGRGNGGPDAFSGLVEGEADVDRVLQPFDAVGERIRQEGTRPGQMPASNGRRRQEEPEWLRTPIAAVKNGVNRWWGGKVRGRRLPSELEQCWVVVMRSASKWANDSETRVLDLLTIAMVALALGAVQGYAPSIDNIPPNFVMALLGMALLSTMSALRTFGSESVIFLQRESPGGLYTVAYWAGRQVWDTADLLWRPAIYMGLYHSMTTPSITRSWLYTVMLCVTWYSYGVGYLISVTVDRSVGTLVGVAVPLIYGGVINGLNPTLAELRAGTSPLRFFADVSYTRWGVEALTIKEAEGVDQSRVLLTAGVLAKLGYCKLESRVGRGLPTAVGLNDSSSTTSNMTLTDYQTILGVDKNSRSVDPNQRAKACELARSDVLDTQGKQLAQMWCYYNQPAQLQHDCRPFFSADLRWLLIIGVILRLLTLLVLKYKVWRKKQK